MCWKHAFEHLAGAAVPALEGDRGRCNRGVVSEIREPLAQLLGELVRCGCAEIGRAGARDFTEYREIADQERLVVHGGFQDW